MAKNELQFTEAYEKYSLALYRYCYFKISDREIAKDMLQQTFTKVWEYMGKYGSILNLRAFLYKTLSNLIIDEYRKRRRTESLELLEERDGFDPPFDDTDRWVDQVDGEQAFTLVQQMPVAYRDVLKMKYIKGFSLKEIAKATGKNENAIAVCIHRGMNRLRILFFANNELRHKLG